mgnify:FL=1
MKRTYKFKARVWLYPGDAAWHFVTLPQKTSLDIDDFFGHMKKGFGSLPVKVTVDQTLWQTSIFPSKQEGSYILPLKAPVRKAEGIKVGDTVSFSVELASLNE